MGTTTSSGKHGSTKTAVGTDKHQGTHRQGQPGGYPVGNQDPNKRGLGQGTATDR